MKRFALVYQAGIANVFELTEDTVSRILQHAFAACEWFCHGLIAAGETVEVYSCNRAGDIAAADWTRGLSDCPFRDAARPPSAALFVRA